MITTTEKLWQLCNKHQLFTAGTNEQYNKFFSFNENNNPSIKELALILWVCSSGYTIEQITKILEDAHREYLESQGIPVPETEEEVKDKVYRFCRELTYQIDPVNYDCNHCKITVYRNPMDCAAFNVTCSGLHGLAFEDSKVTKKAPYYAALVDAIGSYDKLTAIMREGHLDDYTRTERKRSVESVQEIAEWLITLMEGTPDELAKSIVWLTEHQTANNLTLNELAEYCHKNYAQVWEQIYYS